MSDLYDPEKMTHTCYVCDRSFDPSAIWWVSVVIEPAHAFATTCCVSCAIKWLESR